MFTFIIRRRRVRRRRRAPNAAKFNEHKAAARRLVEAKITAFNSHYNFLFKKIFIKNQTSRWGSCSQSGNLNFNYRVALIPEALADYVIVHELCHLKEFNHSSEFWKLVAETIPDFRSRRLALRKMHLH